MKSHLDTISIDIILIIVPMCSGFSLLRRQASLRGHNALKLSLEQQKRRPVLCVCQEVDSASPNVTCHVIYACVSLRNSYTLTIVWIISALNGINSYYILYIYILLPKISRHGHKSDKLQMKYVTACNAKLHLNLVAESMIAAWRKRFEIWQGIDSNPALPSADLCASTAAMFTSINPQNQYKSTAGLLVCVKRPTCKGLEAPLFDPHETKPPLLRRGLAASGLKSFSFRLVWHPSLLHSCHFECRWASGDYERAVPPGVRHFSRLRPWRWNDQNPSETHLSTANTGSSS